MTGNNNKNNNNKDIRPRRKVTQFITYHRRDEKQIINQNTIRLRIITMNFIRNSRRFDIEDEILQIIFILTIKKISQQIYQ